MTDDAALYRLMSWLSPSYPVGAYSYSHGIEYAVEAGLVADRGSLAAWIETALLLGSGQSDGVFFRETFHAVADANWDRLAEMAELACAFRASAEMAIESLGQGEAFLATTRAVWAAPALDRLKPPIAYPVAVAAACAAHEIPLTSGLFAYLHGFAANLVSAGVRLIPLGQTDGQAAMRGLENAICCARDKALATPLDDLGTATPIIDWASMRHETQYTRLFRS